MCTNTDKTYRTDHNQNQTTLKHKPLIFLKKLNYYSVRVFTLIIALISNDRNHADHVKPLKSGLSSSILYTIRLRISDIT